MRRLHDVILKRLGRARSRISSIRPKEARKRPPLAVMSFSGCDDREVLARGAAAQTMMAELSGFYVAGLLLRDVASAGYPWQLLFNDQVAGSVDLPGDAKSRLMRYSGPPPSRQMLTEGSGERLASLWAGAPVWVLGGVVEEDDGRSSPRR